MSPASKTEPITIAVTRDIRTLFKGFEIRGQGGFQALCREIVKRINSGQPVLRFAPNEFRRITHYATMYGEGGYQARLRIIVSQWAAQYFDAQSKN